MERRSAERDVRTSDGRTLRVREAGDPRGKVVLFHHGTPMSGLLFDPWVHDAEGKNLRLIAYDRPGYGGSTPHPDRTVSDAASDVATIADAIGVERFATWGLSGGGPHALACAALLSDRVIAAISVSGVGPYGTPDLDFLAGMGEGNVTEYSSAVKGRADLEPLLEGWRRQILDASPEESLKAIESIVSDVDKAAFTGEFAEYLHECDRIGIGDGIEGWVEDDLAFTKPWGFNPSDISVPVGIWQGGQDLMVPFAHGEWLVTNISGAEAHLEPALGHFTIPTERISEIHNWLIAGT